MNARRSRQRWGDRLVTAALNLAADRHRLERSLTAARAGTPGVTDALVALTPARWMESALLWIGFRLQTRTTTVR